MNVGKNKREMFLMAVTKEQLDTLIDGLDVACWESPCDDFEKMIETLQTFREAVIGERKELI